MPLFPDVHIHVHVHTSDPGTNARLDRLEHLMTDSVEQLTGLRADLVDVFADVDAKLDQLLAAQGELSPEAQVIFDDIKATVAAADERVGDADGSDIPPVEPGDGESEPA